MSMVIEPIFSNHFWGLKDDGYYVLTAKINNNKKTYEEIKSFYNTRASLHEEFGRKLMKHAKNNIGRDELGTFYTLIKSAQEEMERTAQNHIDLGYKLKSVLEVYLDNFVLEQKDKKKLTQASVEKAHRFKQSSESYLLKIKEKYESNCAKLITLQTQIGSVSGREVDKIRQKIEKTQQDIKLEEQEYKNACQKLGNATLSWNKVWKTACDTYQVMEKERLEFLHHSFSMYVNILSSVNDEERESHKRFLSSLDQFDIIKDIYAVISDKGTGPKIPEAERFVDYMDDPSQKPQSYSIAHFTAPDELMTTLSDQSKTFYPTTVDNLFTESQILSPSLNNKRILPKETQTSSSTLNTPTTNKSTFLCTRKPLNTSSAVSLNHKSTDYTAIQMKSQISIEKKPIAVENQKVGLQNLSFNSTNEKKENSIDLNLHEPVSTPNLLPRHSLLRNKLNSTENNFNKQIKELKDILLSPNQESKDILLSPNQESKDILLSPNQESKDRLLSPNKIYHNTNRVDTEAKENDIVIDPMTNVILAIGNNMFKVDYSTNNKKHNQLKNHNTEDLKAFCDFSYQGLFENLGLANNKINIQETKNKTESSTKSKIENKGNIKSLLSPYRSKQSPLIINKKKPSKFIHNIINPIVQPPTLNISNQNKQLILFWALTLHDNYSKRSEELSFSKGTWLSVIEVKDENSFYAIKFDSTLNCLTNEVGFVYKSSVEVYKS